MIEKQYRRFFTKHGILSKFQPYPTDEHTFLEMQSQLLEQLTTRASQIAENTELNDEPLNQIDSHADASETRTLSTKNSEKHDHSLYT